MSRFGKGFKERYKTEGIGSALKGSLPYRAASTLGSEYKKTFYDPIAKKIKGRKKKKKK